jgi:hypothetical protein
MQHDPRAWLWDVQQAAERITDFVRDRSFADYFADAMMRAAVERQFEIYRRGAQSSVARGCGDCGAYPGSSAGDRHAECADPRLSRGERRGRLADGPQQPSSFATASGGVCDSKWRRFSPSSASRHRSSALEVGYLLARHSTGAQASTT